MRIQSQIYKLDAVGVEGATRKWQVRDVWRKKNLPPLAAGVKEYTAKGVPPQDSVFLIFSRRVGTRK